MNVSSAMCVLVLFLCLLVVTGESNLDPHNGLKIAFCLTGQLARLELVSKVKNIFVPNANFGHRVNVFVAIDGNVSNVQQTLYNYDYSNNPYIKFSEAELNEYFVNTTKRFYSSKKSDVNRFPIVYRTKFISPPDHPYAVRGNRIPVADKMVPGIAGIETGASRFQKNMRWMSGVRDCVKWVQSVEVRQRWLYDAVVRLRDDSYALNTWLLSPSYKYSHGIVSVNFGLHHGINDHNFVVARKWADVLLRGMTEDYYLNDTLDDFTWLNPEHRIAKVAESLQMPVYVNTLCVQPLLPLRGLEENLNHSKGEMHWRLHPAYIKMAFDQCSDHEKEKLNKLAEELTKLGIVVANSKGLEVLDASCCEKSWMQIIDTGFVPIVPVS